MQSIIPYGYRRSIVGYPRRSGYTRSLYYRRPSVYRTRKYGKSIRASRVASCKRLVKSRVHYTVSFKPSDKFILPQLGYVKPKKGYVVLAAKDNNVVHGNPYAVKGIFKDGFIERIVKSIEKHNYNEIMIYDKDGIRADLVEKVHALTNNVEEAVPVAGSKRVKT